MAAVAIDKAVLDGLKAAPKQGFVKVILKEGTGAQAVKRQKANVHYTGVLENGKKFDSSRDRGTPFSFTLGAQQVIRGWDEGVATMKIGEKSVLYLTPDFGYGSRGAAGVIPPNAYLIFEVELLSAS